MMMKYMVFDSDAYSGENGITYNHIGVGAAIIALSFFTFTTLYFPFCFSEDLFLYPLLWILGLLLIPIIISVLFSALWSLRKYDLSEEGINYKWFFGKGVLKREDILCYGLLPDIAGVEEYGLWIVLFAAANPPRYPMSSNQDPQFGQLTKLEIKYNEKRFEEIKQFADQNEIPFIGKEGKGRRYEFSSWFKELDRKTKNSIESPPSLRLQRGVDDPKRDGIRVKFFWGLAITVTIIFAAVLALFVKWLIDDFSPYGIVDIGIVIIVGILIIPWIIRQNDMYELREEGIFLKQGTSHTLIKWDDIKYCGVVLAGRKEKTRFRIKNGYIIVSLTKNLPEIPIDMDANSLLHRSDRLLIESTYLRIEEIKRYADQHGIRWIDCYDDEGNFSLPEGVSLRKR